MYKIIYNNKLIENIKTIKEISQITGLESLNDIYNNCGLFYNNHWLLFDEFQKLYNKEINNQ